MSKSSPYALTWSEAHDCYEIQIQGHIERSFSLADEAAFSRWLEGHTAFTFLGKAGRLSVLKETRARGAGYWYGYRKQGGHTAKRYLGPSTKVTFGILEEQASALNSFVARVSPAKPHTSLVEQEPVVFASKLAVPRLPGFLVERTHLRSVLDTICSYPLTVVSASAGSGKTTLLSSWALASDMLQNPGVSRETQLVVAWLSLDTLDNDPVRFWISIIGALRHSTMRKSALGQKALTILHSSQQPSFSLILSNLLDEIRKMKREILLILDDYHVIEDQTLQETMRFFLEHLPAHFHLVLLSRTSPELPLARLRVRGQLLEIGFDELRFTREESARFLVHHMGLPLTQAEVELLEARTEGWIAGLHLTALALRKQADLSSAISTFTGHSRFVQEYVQQEILAALPASLQEFLLQSAILPRMNAAICQAVTAASNLRDCQQMLEGVERANLFVVALDSERGWYRFHDLFREVLLACLQATSPERVPLLHQRAAWWYEAQGLLEEAITHALEADDPVYAARLLERFVVPQSWRNEYRTLYRFLMRLPSHIVAERPDLSFHYVIARVLTGERGPRALEQVGEAIQWAENGYRAQNNQAGLGALFIMRSVLLAQRGDFAQAFTLAREGFGILPEQEHMWRCHAHTILGSEALCEGHPALARQMYQQGLALSERSGSLPGMLMATAMLGEVALTQGDQHTAAQLFRRVLALSEEQHILRQNQLISKSGARERHYERLALYGLAQLAYNWNQLEKAEELLQDACAEGRLVWAHMHTAGSVLHARLLLARGEVQQTRVVLGEIASRTQRPEILREIAWCQALIALKGEDLTATECWAASLPAEMPLPLPRREEEMWLLARLRIAQGQPYAALDMLEGLKQAAFSERRKHSALQSLVLEAIALEASGAHVQARETLVQACKLARLEGYQRLFLDEGPAIEALLKALLRERKEEDLVPFLRTLLQAFHETHGNTSPPQTKASSWLIEPLTPQEGRVLHLLVEGLTNQEIADRLIISRPTAKKHVANVLAKLGAQNRTQAALLAREYALL